MMLSVLYAISPVCLSVCQTVTRMNQSKAVEVRIMKYSPLPSALCGGKFHPEILMGSSRAGRQTRDGWDREISKPCSSSKRQYLENGRRCVQSY